MSGDIHPSSLILHPLLGTGPDLELDSESRGEAFTRPPSTFVPLPDLAAPPADRGAHHQRLIVQALDQIEARIAELRARARFLDRSATVHILARFNGVTS